MTRAVPVALTAGRRPLAPLPATNGFDLLELPRPAARAPWAYVKVAEGCDRICGFCAIPSFRGKQRSRSPEEVLAEVDALRAPADGAPPLREVVLVAQDLASYGRDRSGPGRRTRIAHGPSPIAALTRAVSARVERTRLLYLYPSGLTDELIETVLATGVPYFDLSLQHVSRPLLARMRRWGDGERFLRRIADIRAADPEATFRSSFILGYPGETERDHDLLLEFLDAAQLDWAGFFPFSREDGTHAAGLAEQVPPSSLSSACASVPSCRTPSRRPSGTRSSVRARRVLVDAPGRGRTVHEAPEIDGIVHVPDGSAGGQPRRRDHHRRGGPDLHAVAADRSPVSAGAGREQQHRERGHPRAPLAPGLRLRTERARHAGQRRHGGPPARCAGLRAHARGLGRLVGQRRGRPRARRQRRARRLHGPSPRHDPLGRLPRPAGRQGRASSAPCSPWPPRATCPGCPVVLITVREVGMQLYRSWVGRRGVSIPARKSAKLKTLVQDIAIGTVIIPPAGPPAHPAGRRDLVRLRTHALHRRRVPARRPTGAAPAGRP